MRPEFKIETRVVSHLEAHPLSDEIFGQMEEEEFQELKQDIDDRGINHPLELNMEGQVICGSQRLRALKELNVEIVEVRVVKLDGEAAVVRHLLLDNLLRRHLTPGMIYKAGKALEGIKLLGGEATTTAHIAGELKKVTSYTNYWRIQKIMESGDKELIESMESGRLKVTVAHKQLQEQGKKRMARGVDSRQKDVMKFIRYRKRLDRMRLFLRQNPMDEFGTYSKEARRSLRDVVDIAQELVKA